MSCFTHTGPFQASLLQSQTPRGPVRSEGLSRSPTYQSVLRAGELKSDEFHPVEHPPSVSRGVRGDSVKRRLTWDVQEGGLQEGLWHGVHSQPELTGRRCAGDPCSVYAESSHSLGPGFCVTPEAQCVPAPLARKWCGGCQLMCEICFLNLFDNETPPQKIITLSNYGKKHMDFPSASCLFQRIGLNLSRFRAAVQATEGSQPEGSSCLYFMDTGQGED